MKKILMIAVFSDSSTNDSQANGFENCGWEVIRYNYRERAKEIGKKSRDAEIIDICQKERPELVFFSKCNDVSIDVVHECNKISKTILWYMDPLKRGKFHKELKKKITHCTYGFFALTVPYKKAQAISPNTVHFLQEGFDEKKNYPIDTPYVNDVAFIGHLRGERADYQKEFGFKVYNDAYGEKHSQAVSETKINLNFTNGGTSDRTYKVLASKGFLLTQPWPDMEKDFVENQDFVTFRNPEELRTQINYYLKDEEMREIIASRGHQAVQKFNRTNFARRIIATCGEE